MNDAEQEGGVVPPPSYAEACASGPSSPIKPCQNDFTQPREQSLWTWHKKGVWIRAETQDGQYVKQGTRETAKPDQYLHHGMGERGAAATGYPEIYFTCKMQPRLREHRGERRRYSEKEVRGYCKSIVDALAFHRESNKCSFDFESLGRRVVGSGNYTRISLAPDSNKCQRRWYRGNYLRSCMKLHDKSCACGCFGQVVQK